ncbi:MAG TPA: hypothetical protein VLM75_05610 [Spirochaetota bacterium]|nr:hypothetical protein [Spirochaetota bacterium]
MKKSNIILFGDPALWEEARPVIAFNKKLDHLDGVLFIDRIKDAFIVNTTDGSGLSVRGMLIASPPAERRSAGIKD